MAKHKNLFPLELEVSSFFLAQLVDNVISGLVLGADITNPQDLDQYIVIREDSLKKYTCGVCNSFCHQSRSNVRNHLESKHFAGYFSYACDICLKVMGTNKAMEVHKSIYHPTRHQSK